MFLQPQFTTALLPLAYMTHIDKDKHLIFVKTENFGPVKCIFDKFRWNLKGPPFYGEWT